MATLQTADLLATLGILAAVDMRQRVVPNEILIYYLAGQFILGIYGNSLAGLFGIWTTGGITFGILAVVCLFSKGRLGFGDVKLLGAVAVTAGWQYCFVMIFYALFLSFFYSLYLLIWKRKGAGEEFPFVPFLAGGAILQLLLAL